MGWSVLGETSTPPTSASHSQHAWDDVIVKRISDRLLETAPDDNTGARLHAVMSPHAGDWLNASPITAVGLRLSNDAIRIATGLRLGTNLCWPHTCRCGAPVDARGNHGLSCSRSAGRIQRHALINDIVQRALVRAKISAIKESGGVFWLDQISGPMVLH